MELKCAPTITDGTAPAAVAGLRAKETRRALRVLLVEDDPSAAEIVEIHVTADQHEQFHVEWSRNLHEALTRLSQPGIDVILLDLGMPELSGHQSFRAVTISAAGKVPIVVFTADDSTDSRNRSLQLGAADYLVKGSVSAARLRRALRDAAGRNTKPFRGKGRAT